MKNAISVPGTLLRSILDAQRWRRTRFREATTTRDELVSGGAAPRAPISLPRPRRGPPPRARASLC